MVARGSLRVLFFGTDAFALPTLQLMVENLSSMHASRVIDHVQVRLFKALSSFPFGHWCFFSLAPCVEVALALLLCFYSVVFFFFFFFFGWKPKFGLFGATGCVSACWTLKRQRRQGRAGILRGKPCSRSRLPTQKQGLGWFRSVLGAEVRCRRCGLLWAPYPG